MKKFWQLIATFVLVAALASPGYAAPGDGNGGGKSGKPKKEKRDKADKPAKNNGEKGKKANKADKPEKSKKPKKEKGQKHNKGNKGHKPKKIDAGTSSSFTIGQIIVTDDRIVDLTGDYLLEGVLINTDGTSSSISTSVSLVQDGRGVLVGSSFITSTSGTVVEVPLTGELELAGDGTLSLTIEGALEDGSTSINIDGEWDGTAFISVVTITDLGVTTSYDAIIIPVNTMTGFVVEEGQFEQVKGNKTWAERTVVLPWGNETVRSQHMNKKGFKFMMHSGNFGLDLRGTVDETGLVDLTRAKLHLGYGNLWLDPATVSVLLPAVQLVP